jgi:SAM-dependent methyltransferase
MSAVRETPEASPIYDAIGVGYSRFRRSDPRIEALILAALGDARRVVNVGAGTGSYEPADRAVLAVEPSPQMIRQRSRTAAPCVRGDATRLQFEDGEFDAAMAILTLHHWLQPEVGLRELRRVANGVVVFTFDPSIHNAFWLFRDYVPAITTLESTAGVLAVDRIAEIIDADRVEPVLVPHDCMDGFGCAYWRRPHAYLDPDVRRCISAFGLIDSRAVTRGVERLRSDLETRRWHERYRLLLDLEAFDGGLRLVVRDPR